MTIRPQHGPQEAFLASPADIAVFGGSAGGGKSFGLLMEPLRHIGNSEFGAVVFRRTAVQVRNEGGLWDTSEEIYPHVGAVGTAYNLRWTFPSGAKVSFAHLEHPSDRLGWQGAQIPLIAFDELTHFSEQVFWFMLSRNRSTCGIRPYVRATCNPDPDSFVAELLSWWIDQETGYAIPARSGVVRWMVREGDRIHWFDTSTAAIDQHGPECGAKSITFIRSKLEDNRILMERDPGYLANLRSLPMVDRERLLHGNWRIRPAGGSLFRREWFEVVDVAPQDGTAVRYWDRAATEKRADNDPDWTAGVRLRKSGGVYYVEDLVHLRDRPLGVERSVLNTAKQEPKIMVGIEEDPGQAGVADAQAYVRLLDGFNVRLRRPTGDKVTRAKPVSAQAEAGNIKIVRGAWNREFLDELEGFPDAAHDDIVDALSGAYGVLSGGRRILVA